jgi:hypothetical protein
MYKTLNLSAVLLFMLLINTSGQLAVGYNTDGNTLSLSTDPINKFYGELRVNTKYYNQASWSYNDRGITQALVLVRVFTAAGADFYAGAGLGVNLLSEESTKWFSIDIPVGLRMNPFTKFQNLFIAGEYNPMIITSEGVPVIHSVSLGFRYRLIREQRLQRP